MTVMRFPKQFNFGATILAKDDEGGFDQGNKGLTTYDVLTASENVAKLDLEEVLAAVEIEGLASYPSRQGVDFYHRLDEDLQTLVNLGISQVLVSLSWARLFPKGEELSPNEVGLKFYQILLTKIKALGLEPIVILGDGALPLNLSVKYNGWATRRLVADFNRYANACFDNFGQLVSKWLTFIDLTAVLNTPYLAGGILSRADAEIAYQALVHQLLASSLASKNLHEQFQASQLGYGISYQVDLTEGRAAFEQNFKQRLLADLVLRGAYSPLLAQLLEQAEIELDLDELDAETLAESKVDFIYLNWPETQHNLEVALLELTERYQLPIIVGDFSSKYRQNIQAVARALSQKATVVGYFPQVFNGGLVAVASDLTRQKTAAYNDYQDIIFNNGLEI
ncbi:family 1 glycosylhydrolase [Ligilactobacillus agilis]|uniref:family 1 glycosylhydrolase n=1 Tax=Ligilactobacillus agilis TaxID=1601 RepID=UPI003F8A8534